MTLLASNQRRVYLDNLEETVLYEKFENCRYQQIIHFYFFLKKQESEYMIDTSMLFGDI